MVDKGNVDKYRRGYSTGVNAKNESVWGHNTASERYGPLKYQNGAPAPADKHAPQSPENKHGPNYDNRTPNTWVRGFGKGGGNESAEGKPGYGKITPRRGS
jgi:hypothetical protein